MTRKRILPLFLLVVLSIPLIPSILPNVHALTPSLFSSATATCTSSCSTVLSTAGASEIIVVGQFGGGAACGAPTVTDTFGSAFSSQGCVTINTGSTQSAIWVVGTTNVITSSGSDTVTVATPCNNGTNLCAIIALDYTQFTGFGVFDSFTSASASGTNTRTNTVFSQSLIIGQAGVHVDGVSCGTETTGSSQQVLVTNPCQTVSANGSTNSIVTSNTGPSSGGAYTDTVSWSGGGVFGRWLLELKGVSQSSSNGLTTQCFGNCGSPAITLVNTNSTHSFAFNQSITVFYEFQTTLTGTLLNVTTNIAKNYANGQQVNIGVYIANCNVGVTPFTASCPGQLRASQNGNLNPVKGKLVFSPSSLSINNGQWIAISITAVFSGLDLNDTNTNVNLFQQSGQTPGILAQSVQSSCACKMGLWTWIIGTTTSGPSIVPPVSCGTDFICQLTQACIGLTPTNIVVGCFFLGIVWSIITIAALMYVGYKFGGIVLPGGVFILIFWAWTTFFLSLAGGAGIAFIILEAIIVMIIFSGAFGSLFSGGLRVGSGRETA